MHVALPNFLWGDAIRIIAYIKNQVPNRCCKKSSLRYFHVVEPKWTCIILLTNELDLMTIVNYFFGYCSCNQGGKFYYPIHNTKVIYLICAIFFVDSLDNGSKWSGNAIIREKQIIVSPLLVETYEINTKVYRIQLIVKVKEYDKISHGLKAIIIDVYYL